MVQPYIKYSKVRSLSSKKEVESLGGNWTNEEILAEITKRKWYHKIELRPGIFTPGISILEDLWAMTRETRTNLSYEGKRVLDLASFDGMWVFEAEKLGASVVVATDCLQPLYANFELCKDILKSKAIPFYNTSPYRLWEGLQVLLMDDMSTKMPFPKQIHHNLFDIVQHLGLLYHVRDPLWTLSQCRSVVKTGGHLLLETAAILHSNESKMVLNGTPGRMNRIYQDDTTWWLPTVPCVLEMLENTLFEPLPHTIRTLESGEFNGYKAGRVSLVAKAIPGSQIDPAAHAEILRTFRNPGLVPDYL